MRKGILTIAIGKKFNKMAKYLALSCIINNPSLPRAIITDNADYIKGFFDIIIEYEKEMGNPFNLKLKMIQYTPFYETLFLDADTLVYNNLDFYWEYFNSQSIIYIIN